MYTVSAQSSWFGARTVVASVLLIAAVATFQVTMGQQQDNCKIECYPNTKIINGKGGIGKSDNCRWILRTDGKPARLCDHIKCKKVCPTNQAQQQPPQEQQEAAASDKSDNLHIEQQIEGENGAPIAPPAAAASSLGESMGIMRHMHGNKLAKAPVPGVAGGRLTPAAPQQQQQQQQAAPTGGRRQAPTLPPAVEYDEKDTPPPIARFLDISPEE